MWRHRPTRAVADSFRLLAVAAMVAAQCVAAGRCGACDADECAACLAAPGAGNGTAHEAAAGTAACPLCAAAATDACRRAAGEPGAKAHDPAPCECQWQPRDDEPIAAPSRAAVDPPAVAPWSVTALDDHRATALVARLPAFTDIPLRPVRILLGVWRN